MRATRPSAESELIEPAVAFVRRLGKEKLSKTPGVAETLDWVRAFHRLNFKALPDDPAQQQHTLACLLKTGEDRFQLGPDKLRQVLEGRRHEGVGVAVKSVHAALS